MGHRRREGKADPSASVGMTNDWPAADAGRSTLCRQFVIPSTTPTHRVIRKRSRDLCFFRGVPGKFWLLGAPRPRPTAAIGTHLVSANEGAMNGPPSKEGRDAFC